jgi:hypothetical protein
MEGSLAELEIHHETGHEDDPKGRQIGLLAALLAVALTLVTIASHRTHTRAIVLQSEANDQWQYFQAKRIKFHNLELSEDLLAVLGSKSEAVEKLTQRYEKEKERYKREGEEIQTEARKIEAEVGLTERRGLRYDFGEGLLEIGLVLASLYFISRKSFFPVLGLFAGLAGAATALSGFLLR